MTIVTALRPTPAGVVVELDGVVWRTLPVDAVVEAGLGVGLELDRARAVALARARRRSRAEDVAVRALARREHSRTTLDARLARAGVGATVRRETVERAERRGLVDDGRFAEQRAQHLAERGAGDALVRDDLARQGIDEPVARSIVGRARAGGGTRCRGSLQHVGGARERSATSRRRGFPRRRSSL